MRRPVLIAMLFASACGQPSAPSPSPADNACSRDDECMVGTPRNCCIQFCDYDDVAWSQRDWAKYQIKCAHDACPNAEWLECDPDIVAVEYTARCDAGHCVLVPPS